MAVTSTPSNHYLYKKQQGTIDLTSDTIKAALMNSTFVFDPDAHATWADVSSQEISTSGSYVQVTLTNPTQTEDDSENKAVTSFDNITFTPSGGDFDASAGCIIYDTTDGESTVIAGIDFGTAHTVTDGNNITLQNPQIEDSGVASTI